ncbi:hypothetical protein [Bacillus sp. FJAT-49736]|uniref:hypothetical protein n=1 Tax=Bacillus sp. FJAT-49736 TaxID=2833582 RepID=UPI001BC8CC37|nr:hypothetical protein [Bacillus sp. FJAT-49736]MBS4172333.1 hypothetical protein [Bacillus sp. FJAT-49736]
MDPKNQFKNLLISVMRQLWLLHVTKQIQLLFLLTGAYSFLLFLISRILVIPYIYKYWLIGFFIIILFGTLRIFRQRPTFKQSVQLYDDFLGENRAGTAFAFIEREEEIYQLQRNDAVKQMKETKNQVLQRKKKWIYSMWIICGILLWSGAAASHFIPNATMHAAKQKEKELELIKKVEKKLGKQAKVQTNKELEKTLEKVKKDLKSSKDAREALNKLIKQNNQLELKQYKANVQKAKLQNLQNDLKSAGLNSLAKALSQNDIKSLGKEFDRLKQNWNQLSEKQKQALQQLSNSTKPLTKEELSKLKKQLKDAIILAGQQKDLQLAQDAIQKSALDLQQAMITEGMLDSNEVAYSPNKESSPQSSKGNTGTGNKATNQNNGQGTANGQGAGQGQGQGQTGATGNGNGSGNGNGNGQGGNGGSKGRGAGRGQGDRKFLTIPDKVNGGTNIEKDLGKLGPGGNQQQTSGNGPVLRGSIRPYEEVYGQYERAFRDNAERIQLPSQLEELVKQYFTNLNPD